MRKLLLASLALLISAPLLAAPTAAFKGFKDMDFDAVRARLQDARQAEKGLIPQAPGFYMDVVLTGVTVFGGNDTASFLVFWGGPGYYSIYGGCPTGDCTGGQYQVTDFVLPPGGIGILTHTGIFTPDGFPSSTYTTPGGAITTYSTTVATSQPNNLHGFFVLRYDDGSFPVFFTTSVPGQAQLGPGRNYVAAIEVPNLRGGRYLASAMQRLLHYTTTSYSTPTPFKGIVVGGTPDSEISTSYRYLVGYEYFDINVIVPTTSSYGLVALGMILVGAGLLFMRRRQPHLA